MMKIKCKCGNIVAEGEVVIRENKKGTKKKKLDIKYLPRGSIIKNKSNDPKEWEGICSDCQRLKKKGD